MKFLLLLVSLTYVASLEAQTYSYVPMPLDSAQWRCRQYIGASGGRWDTHDELMYTTGEDTTLFGHTYKKVFLRYHSWPTTLDANKPPMVDVVADAPDCFCGGMREAGKVVYFIGILPQFGRCYDSAIDTMEYEYYNFNLNAGDALDNGLTGYMIGDTISYIDSIAIGGVLRKRYHTVHETSTYPDYLLEGIGSIRGLQPYPTPGYYYNDLLCFSQHGSILYTAGSSACSAILPYGTHTMVSSYSVQSKDVKVYPSPFTGIINVEGAEGLSVTLYNSIGAEVNRSVISNSGTCEFTGLSYLPPGMYYVMVRNENNATVLVHKLVKQ